MGVFTGNTTSLGAYNPDSVVANESYDGAGAIFQMIHEGLKNDQAIFEAVIEGDFDETTAKIAGVYTESVEVIQEGASEIIEKIKAAVKKAWEKLKGLFKAFIAKLDGVIMRDNKALFKKYQKVVYSKDNLSGMKFKWAKPKGTIEALSATRFGKAQDLCAEVFAEINKSSLEDLKKLQSDISDGTAMDEFLAEVVAGSDKKSFAKDFHDTMFEDTEKETDGLSSEVLKEIARVLQENKMVSTTQKAATDIDKGFQNILKGLDSLSKTAVNDIVKDADADHEGKVNGTERKSNAGNEMHSNVKYGGDSGMKRINCAREVVSTLQRGCNMCTSAYLTAVKFHIAQCRRVWIQAASFTGKAQNESMLFNAIGESVDWEVASDFETYSN